VLPPGCPASLGCALALSHVEGSHPGGNPGANLKSITHRCHLQEVAFQWELTKETIYSPLGCLQGGCQPGLRAGAGSCRGEIGILLPNNQFQYRTLLVQKDVLPHTVC